MEKKVMLMYPPGKLYQRSEDRAQCNVESSSALSIHACNDLGYCSAILKKSDYKVFLHDYEMDFQGWESLKNDILNFQPDLIFMSTTNATILDDLAALENVACLVGGEIEFSILPLVNYYLKGEGNLNEISGICYRKNDSFVKTDFHCWNQDLDSLPFPDRDAMDNGLYLRPDNREPMATISIGRGCPSQCIYCLTPVISGIMARIRSTDNVMAELRECYEKYGIRNFFFKADTFTINKQWAIELCDKIIQSGLCGKIAFTANARANTIEPVLLKKMKEAGCFTIAVGFESGSDRSLKLMKKGITREQNLKAAKLIKESGIPLFAFFMLGFPWESMEDVKQTVDIIFEINPDFIEVAIAMPYYGTELFEKCRELGLIDEVSFGHDYYLSPNTIGTKYVDIKTLKKIRKRILLKFYLRPTYICRKIFGAIKHPRVVLSYIHYGFRLLKINVFQTH